MANDREVLRILWEGQIPVCFQADPDEANAVRQPENFYLMISRLSYLPLVTDKVFPGFIFSWIFYWKRTLILFRFAGQKAF